MGLPLAPFPGGVLLRDQMGGAVVGAIGVSGASADEDEHCALVGARAVAGFKTEPEESTIDLDKYWPEAWYMADDVPAGEAQKLEQRLQPNKPAGAAALEELGIYYWNVPPDEWAHLYPPISVPWDPAEAKDPKLVEIREERGYR